MNIVIPMAGHGSRFSQAGYLLPKPLISVRNKPMIQVVIENVAPKKQICRFIFLALREHCQQFDLKKLLPKLCYPHEGIVIEVNKVTKGAACTVLLAKDFIDNEEELLIANADQWVEWSCEDFLYWMRDQYKADAGILTFQNRDPKWSYAKMDISGRVSEVAEKNPISNHATVGIYWFQYGYRFVDCAEVMIWKNIQTNGEFYVCPVFNELIKINEKVMAYGIRNMRGMGTPEDLQKFLENTK